VAQANKYSVPRMCFVNKLDRTGADFFRCVDMMVERLNATPRVLQLPIGAEQDFIGVVDLVQMRALTWRGETTIGEDYEVEEIPAELADQAAEYREKLIETLADGDDEIMEQYLEGRGAHHRAAHGRHPPRHAGRSPDAGAVRQRVQEQGRPARCSTRSCPTFPRRWTSARSRVWTSATSRSRSSASPPTASRSPHWRSRSPPTRTSAS
jgi:hypothetical protein